MNTTVPGYTDVQPENSAVDFGQVDYFKYINNDNEVLKSVDVMLVLDALTAAASGTNPRYVDDVICAGMEKVEFFYGGKCLQSLTGDEIHFRLEQETPEEEYDRICHLSVTNTTARERAALATGQQLVSLTIPFWWCRNETDAWHQYAFQRLTRVVITWRNAGFLLQQDSEATNVLPTPTAGGRYIVNHWLRFRVSAISEAAKQTYVKQIAKTENDGWLYLIQDWQALQSVQALQAATTTTIQLNTFTKYGYNIRFWVRPVANLLADTRNNNRWFRYDITSAYLDISGKRYYPEHDMLYLKYNVNGTMFHGNQELPTYNIPFTDYPEVHRHSMGGIDFSNAATPQLVLKHAALPANCYIDVYLQCHNYVRLVLSGSKSAAEVVQPL
jgi:hypothetical protein